MTFLSKPSPAVLIAAFVRRPLAPRLEVVRGGARPGAAATLAYRPACITWPGEAGTGVCTYFGLCTACVLYRTSRSHRVFWFRNMYLYALKSLISVAGATGVWRYRLHRRYSTVSSGCEVWGFFSRVY